MEDLVSDIRCHKAAGQSIGKTWKDMIWHDSSVVIDPIRTATIQLPDDMISIAIFASWYDTYRDNFLARGGTLK